MRLTELFSPEELDVELQAGYVKEQKHPTLPLVILNYTDKTTYDRRWNNVTMHCRGLIVDEDYLKVIARGPRKFFNYGEPSATEYPLTQPVRVTRKEDGSLGIGWSYDDGEDWRYGIATRGSFTSEQANHASELVFGGSTPHYEVFPDSIDQYADLGVSYISEIIYPENRIVLDYEGKDEVYPLGTVDNRTGLIEWRPDHDGRLNKVMTLGEALALPIPSGEEGHVLDILDANGAVIDHLKLKGEWYKTMHAAVFGLTEKRVWEQWCEGDEPKFIEELPDELQPWALAVAQRLDNEWAEFRRKIRAANTEMRAEIGWTHDRKTAAKYIMEYHKDLAPAMFAMLDGNVVKMCDWIDKQCKPGHVPYASTSLVDA